MTEIYTHYLPDDLQASILQNLPSKPLIKFLTTSKSWYSLIKSPNFITLHLNQQLKSNNNNHRLFLLKSHKSFFLYRYGAPIGQRRLRLQSPPNGFDTVAASCHTLLCLSSHSNVNNLLIWNPSINRFKRVPISIMCDNFSYTFGLTDNVGGYKLVMIGYPKTSDLFDGYYSTPPFAQVYSVNDRKGKQISLAKVLLDDDHVVSRVSTGFVVNGFIHWIVFRQGDDVDGNGVGYKEYVKCILTFDPRDDCFAVMQLPTLLKELDDPDLSLTVVDDCLAMVHHLGMQNSIRVWRMEEYGVDDSWKMSYEIKLSNATKTKFWAEEYGKVFIATCSGKLIAFDLNSNDDSGVYDGHLGMTGGQAFDFTQSLLFLNDDESHRSSYL